jgi:prepilin-type N-terminal cleavage/methylation domain-containing protein
VSDSVSAFTLIELLVVIVLMAIIIAISAPAFVGMGRGAGMRGAVSSVRSTLSLLRQWAITHREQVAFVYFQDAGTNFPDSYYYATNAYGTAIISANYNDKYNGSPRLPLEVKFALSGVITFKTDGGLASGAVSTNITIEDRKFPGDTTKAKVISINGLTGGIRVE